MAITRRTLNTGPVIMRSIRPGGGTTRDPLGVTAGYRGAPDFGGLNFVAVPGAPTHDAGYLNHPGADPYSAAGADPRNAYLDPRLAGIDPRNRFQAQRSIAQQAAIGAAQGGATARSLAQLEALRRLQSQQGGRGMPSAAVGGIYRGPVRVHAGEVVYPTEDGAVEVVDPITAQQAVREAQNPADGVVDPDRLRAASEMRVRSGVQAGLGISPESGTFRGVAGRESLSATGPGIADPRGTGMGLRSHDSQMRGILDGSMHPDAASPEVRSAFMQRWASDPEWARRVQSTWAEQENPGVPIEVQREAAARFKAEQQAREAAMTPEERAARDDRMAERDRIGRARAFEREAMAERDRGLRRQALVDDAPLADVRRQAFGGEAPPSGIGDVLFERARNRRDAGQMGQGATPLDAQVGRRARTEAIRAGRESSTAQLIAASTRGTNRGDATVEAARISAAGRLLASPDATPEEKAMARQMLSGQQGVQDATGGVGGIGGVEGGSGVPRPLGGAMAAASDAARQAVLDAFRLRVGPGADGQAEYVLPFEQDIADLADINAPWIRNDPGQVANYRGSANRVVDALAKANALEGEARALAIDMLGRKFQQHGWGSIDMTVSPATGGGGAYSALVRQKRAIQDALLRMMDGRLSDAEIESLRKAKVERSAMKLG